MSERIDDVVTAARAWLGTPYRHQAATLGAGCDCLGLVRGVWRSLYGSEPIEVPPYRANWRDSAHAATLLATAKRLLVPVEGAPGLGHVVLFRLHRALAPKHCGIMTAPDRFIHSQEQIGVVEAQLSEGWRRRVAAVFAFPEIE